MTNSPIPPHAPPISEGVSAAELSDFTVNDASAIPFLAEQQSGYAERYAQQARIPNRAARIRMRDLPSTADTARFEDPAQIALHATQAGAQGKKVNEVRRRGQWRPKRLLQGIIASEMAIRRFNARQNEQPSGLATAMQNGKTVAEVLANVPSPYAQSLLNRFYAPGGILDNPKNFPGKI